MLIKAHLPQKRTVIAITVSILTVAVVAFLVVIALSAWYKNSLASEVKLDLQNIADVMEKSRVGGNGYLVEIPNNHNTEKVSTSGSSSFDGKSYCVTGVSKNDKSIVFHIGSNKSAKTPQSGSCIDDSKNVNPIVPASVAATAGVDTISVTWLPSLYATGYTLQCATDIQFSKNLSTKNNTTAKSSCDKLQPNTEYFYRVRSTNPSGQSVWSLAGKLSTTVLSVAPEGLKTSAISSTKVSYSWQAVPGAISYVVERAQDVNFMVDAVSVNQVSTVGSSTGLKPDTTYYYHVKAVTPLFNADQAAFSSGSTVKTAGS